MNKKHKIQCLSIFTHNTLSTLLYEHFNQEQRDRRRRSHGKMPGGLTDLVLTLLHVVAGPRNRRHGRRDAWHHRCLILAPMPPPPLSPSVVPHHRVLERPPSPSPNQLAYRPIEPSDPDTSPWGCQGRPCAVHSWGLCPN
jgi:hypothetical protein